MPSPSHTAPARVPAQGPGPPGRPGPGQAPAARAQRASGSLSHGVVGSHSESGGANHGQPEPASEARRPAAGGAGGTVT